MMNKFGVLLFVGLFCLANVRAEVDELFPEYWDYDAQWYNDELEKLGIVSQESTEDNDVNEQELPPADVNNHYFNEEVPKQQVEAEDNKVIEGNDKKWNIEPMNDEDADERVQGEINQYLEEQDVYKDELDENGDHLDVNDYLVEDNREDALNSEVKQVLDEDNREDDLNSEEKQGLDELNKKMMEETQELLAREHEGKDQYSQEDWEKIDGIFDENDNLEDIYDDLNGDLESLFNAWKQLSMSGEKSENDKHSDDTEVSDENVDQNKSIDSENNKNQVKDYDEQNGRPYNEGKLLANRDYNYDEIFDEGQDLAQDKNQENENIKQEVDQESEQVESQELAQADEQKFSEEADRELAKEEQENALIEQDLVQEQDKESEQEEESAQREEQNFEEFAQEVDKILAQGANQDLMQEGEGFEQENKEYDEQSQRQDYGPNDFNPESKEEQDRDESYAEEEDHNLSQENEEAAIDNIESEQNKISAKISKAAEEANKTVDEFLYGQHPVYIKDTLDKPNYLETQNSQEIEDFVESDAQIENGYSLANQDTGELTDQMAQFVIDHQEDFDTSLENFDRDIAPVFISLKVDEPTVITSPNYPEGYPPNNIIDWIFDGEGTGIELNITDFFLNGAAGDYLLVKPGGLDVSGTGGLVFSYELTSERRYRFLDVDKMFVRFESKTGMGLRGFSFSVRMIQPIPRTIEEPVTLPTVEIEEDETLKVYLGGLTPAQFLNVSEEFRSIVADMATMYVNSNGLERGNLTILEATKLTVVTQCNINWPNHEYCVSVRFGVNLGAGDNRLNSEDLEEMWAGYVHVDPFASRMRWLGLMEFAAPDAASAIVWLVLGFGALLCGLMLAFTVWRCGSNHYVRMSDQFDSESVSSDKKGMFSDLYPTPHQNLPPLYDGDFLKYELDYPRADQGGFPNKGYTRESELYDIESEEELPTSNRHTDV